MTAAAIAAPWHSQSAAMHRRSEAAGQGPPATIPREEPKGAAGRGPSGDVGLPQSVYLILGQYSVRAHT